MSEENNNEEEKFTRANNPIFFKLWDIMCIKKWKEEDKGKKGWDDYTIYAKTTKDVTMSVWNGNHHPSVEANCTKHICKAGTKVLIWMVSRLGDVGITDNLKDALGYSVRVEADEYLTDLEMIEIKK